MAKLPIDPVFIHSLTQGNGQKHRLSKPHSKGTVSPEPAVRHRSYRTGMTAPTKADFQKTF
jgi:hypothetical protein